MFIDDINYINKLLILRQQGYNIIENVDFTIEKEETNNTELIPKDGE